jgi:hypothetical protein
VDDHEHMFVEEREPSGRLIVGPCIVCGMSAADALDALKRERDMFEEDRRRAQAEWGSHVPGDS